MQSNIVHRSAAAVATAGRELHARMMLSALAINAHPAGLWAAAPIVSARTTEHSTRALDPVVSVVKR